MADHSMIEKYKGDWPKQGDPEEVPGFLITTHSLRN
jgi:hypothetical protein